MARVREEQAKPQRSAWLSWFRAPALAGALALVLMVAGVCGGSTAAAVARPFMPPAADSDGTAVGDLQTLDKNADLYANFDLLDDLQVQPDVDADQETP